VLDHCLSSKIQMEEAGFFYSGINNETPVNQMQFHHLKKTKNKQKKNKKIAFSIFFNVSKVGSVEFS